MSFKEKIKVGEFVVLGEVEAMYRYSGRACRTSKRDGNGRGHDLNRWMGRKAPHDLGPSKTLNPGGEEKNNGQQ
jgi:hypothetical protein